MLFAAYLVVVIGPRPELPLPEPKTPKITKTAIKAITIVITHFLFLLNQFINLLASAVAVGGSAATVGHDLGPRCHGLEAANTEGGTGLVLALGERSGVIAADAAS